jgi:transposase
MQSAPVFDLSTIPTAQRAVVQALLEQVAALKEITQRQEHLIAELNHALHGKRSEKLTEDERQLAFEDLSIALGEVEAAKEKCATKADDGTSKPAPKRTIGNLHQAGQCHRINSNADGQFASIGQSDLHTVADAGGRDL